MFSNIEDAILDIKLGKMIIVVDDEDRENEGDLLMAAKFATEESINFMTRFARGLICAPMEKEALEKLHISQMTNDNQDPKGTAFMVSVDHINSTTGISALERAVTLNALADSNSTPSDFHRPGHIFPLCAKSGGVLERDGHTEAAIDLCKLADLEPAGVICEIMNEDGSMARVPDLEKFSKLHNLKMITIESLKKYLSKTSPKIRPISNASLPTKFGIFNLYGFEDPLTKKEHLALVYGDITSDVSPLVRIHSECLTGDAFGSLRCDCGEQLQHAMSEISKAGSGIVVYLRQEGRGIGILNKIKAYKLQDQGLDTVEANLSLGFEADERNYDIAGEILSSFSIKKVKLMTNNPDKISALQDYGIEVASIIPIASTLCSHNKPYIKTKVEKMNHTNHWKGEF